MRFDASNSTARCLLGNTTGVGRVVAVNGKPHTKEQHFVEALRYDASNSTAWCLLGNTVRVGRVVAVNGKTYTKEDCYLEALRYDPKGEKHEWKSLLRHGPGLVLEK